MEHPTGEVAPEAVKILKKLGVAKHSQQQLLALLLNTLHKMYTMKASILLPQTNDFGGAIHDTHRMALEGTNS